MSCPPALVSLMKSPQLVLPAAKHLGHTTPGGDGVVQEHLGLLQVHLKGKEAVLYWNTSAPCRCRGRGELTASSSSSPAGIVMYGILVPWLARGYTFVTCCNIATVSAAKEPGAKGPGARSQGARSQEPRGQEPRSQEPRSPAARSQEASSSPDQTS